jgi:hypothetical protein
MFSTKVEKARAQYFRTAKPDLSVWLGNHLGLQVPHFTDGSHVNDMTLTFLALPEFGAASAPGGSVRFRPRCSPDYGAPARR